MSVVHCKIANETTCLPDIFAEIRKDLVITYQQK